MHTNRRNHATPPPRELTLGGGGPPRLLAIAFSGVPRWCGFKKIVLVLFNKKIVLKNDLSYVTGLDCLA